MEKYVYIKRNIARHYIDFAEPLNPEEYNNLGTTWQDYLDDKWVLLSAEQLAFKEAHPDASVKEVFDMAITPTPIHVRTLEEAKEEMVNKIYEYDGSDNVNQFTVNGTLTDWFMPDQRSNYRNSIDAAKIVGIENLSLFVGGTSITIPTNTAELLLAQIQLYADACYIVTQQHIAAVNVLESIEAVDAFDYTADYPPKLNFNI